MVWHSIKMVDNLIHKVEVTIVPKLELRWISREFEKKKIHSQTKPKVHEAKMDLL